ncbi:MAG: DASS family sodium-coupled anion symporter [Chlamydiales bacterium]|nr:DASS family sodium-coupled anion symporter [Chlamydiales bacterium]
MAFKLGKKALLGFLGIVFCLLFYFFLEGIAPEAVRRALTIFLLAGFLWGFELFPPFVSSFLLILLLIFSLARPGGVLEMDKTGYTAFLFPFASPIIMLFFGGFTLAAALRKYRVDTFLASRFLGYFGTRPYWIVLGAMLATAFLSMWISNTVSALLMLGIFSPCLKQSTMEVSFRKLLVLAIAFSANLGGIGTPIGSPPNAIAIGLLTGYGVDVTFLQWMLMGVPLVLLLIALASWLLFLLFPTSLKEVDLKLPREPLAKKGKEVLIVACGTIILFVTSPLHEIPEAVTALLCAGTLLASRLLVKEDIKTLDWDVLILMWGGLALGVAAEKTDLGNWLLGFRFFDQPEFLLIILFSVIAYLFSAFMSNTATASLLLPIALGVEGVDKVVIAITIAFVCTTGMVLPISTPPNVLAYMTGYLESADIIKGGTVISLIALLMIFLGFYWIIPLVMGL